MTSRERRIAELAAEDLDGWAHELPIGSETRRDLQQTARAYRFAARVDGDAAPLKAVPDLDSPTEVPRTTEVPPIAGSASPDSLSG